MSRLMFIETSLRRSPSTMPFGLDHLADAVDFVFAQVLDLLHGVHVGRVQNAGRARIADAVDVGQRDIDVLVARKIDACNACHIPCLSAQFSSSQR